MNEKPLVSLLHTKLEEAKVYHTLAVQLGVEKDSEWPEFYARYLAQALKPLLSHIQGVTVTVDGKVVEPKLATSLNDCSGPMLGACYEPNYSRYHVGE